MAICKNCGTEVPGGTEVCPTCGSRLSGESRRNGRRTDRWEMWWGDERVREWSWTWSPFWIMVNAVIFGLGVVLVGTLLFLRASGFMSLVSGDNFWAYLLIGLGALGVIREAAKILVSGRMHWPGGLIFAIVLIVLGAAGLAAQLMNWGHYWWTFVIAAAGLIIILMGIFNYFWMKARFKRFD